MEVDRLTKAIRNEGVLRDPIIVDERSSIVLDGMHRLAGLHRLEAKHAPVCSVDYQNPSVRLGRWFRIVSSATSQAIHESCLEVFGKDSDVEPAGTRDFEDGVLASNGTRIASKRSNRVERLHALSMLEKKLRSRGAQITYEMEQYAMQRFSREGAAAVIAFPALTKDDVLSAALKGRLLPHKTTRHIIPARPLHANIPLAMLTDPRLTDAEANQRLILELNKRIVKRLSPGSSVNGRVYEEEIFLFSEQ